MELEWHKRGAWSGIDVRFALIGGIVWVDKAVEGES